MATVAKDQLALDETVVDEAALETALEARESLRIAASTARLELARADELAKGEIARVIGPALNEDGAVFRVGRFRVERKTSKAMSVSFETQAKDRISIGVVKDEKPRTRKAPASADDDVRPTGEVNVDALRGEVDRATVSDDLLPEPTPIRPVRRRR